MAEPNSTNLQFASLYVGDLHPDCGEALLYEAFSQAGNVASCRVCRDSATRRSLGYAYVNYYSVQDAEKALQTLNYMCIKGKPCRVMWSQRDPDKRKNSNSNLFVKGLDPSIDNKALHDTFNQFGNILSCKVSTNNSGKSRGFGFVHYETEEAAKDAMEKVNGMQIAGSTVYVGPFIKREERDEAESFTNLYVKNMPSNWDDQKITSVFSEFGEVVSSVLLKTEDGKRFALVNLKDPDSAKAAVDALHLKDMRDPEEKQAEEAKEEEEEKDEKDDKETKDEKDEKSAKETPAYLLHVQRAQSRAERKAMLEEERKKRSQGKGDSKGKAGIRICIRNLSEEVTADKLRELFEPFGELSAVILNCDEETKKHRGVGFVVISSNEEAQKAIETLNGQEVEGKPMNVMLSERRRRRGERSDIDGKGGKAGKGDGKGKGRGKGGKGPKGGQQVMPVPGIFPGGVGMMPPNMRPMMPMRPPMAAGFPGMPAMPMAMPAMPVGPRGMPLLPQGLPFPAARPMMPNPMMRPLNSQALEGMPPTQQKQQLGERLYAHNSRLRPDLAGKLTGMMLELPNSEILSLLESDEKLKQKINEAVQEATGSEGPRDMEVKAVKAKVKAAKPARPPASASPPASPPAPVDAKPAKPAKPAAKPAATPAAKQVPALKALAAPKSRIASTTGGSAKSQAAKVPGSRPLTRVSSKALEKKAKEMEQNVKAAQAACLRDSRQSSGRLKSLEAEAASLCRALEASQPEALPAAPPATEVDPPASASAVPSADVPPDPPDTPEAPAEAEEAPRSSSSSLRLKLESLVREEDDEQLAVELQKVLASESAKERLDPPEEGHATGDDAEAAKSSGEDAEAAKSSGQDAKPKKLLPRSPPKVSPKVSPKPSPRPSEPSEQGDRGERPAWDDRFYVVQAPKPCRRSGLEEEHLAKDEVPEKKGKKRPVQLPPRPDTETSKGEAKAAPKRSPKAKPKPQEKARAEAKEAKSAQALTAARFAADRHKRQASR